MTSGSERSVFRVDDFYASASPAFGAMYSAYMERRRLARPIAKLLWGGSTTPYYDSMLAISEVPAGGVIVDCPCGAGPAFRAFKPRARIATWRLTSRLR